jgi:hypothetical protein
MGELAEERIEGGTGAKDCSNGFGSRSKFVLPLRGWERGIESLESEVAVTSGGGGCFCC